MNTDQPMKPPSLWIPEPDILKRAALGKLGEELGECASIVSRCLIQGIAGLDPETSKPNVSQLEDEIADVLMGAALVQERLGLDHDRIRARVQRKLEHKREWLRMLEAHLSEDKA